MASKKRNLEWRKAELIDQIQESRFELAGCLEGTVESLNIVKSIRRSFRENTWRWAGGAVAAGLVMVNALLKSRRAGHKPKKGVAGAVLGTVITVAQPYLLLLLQRMVEAAVASAGVGSSAPLTLREAGLSPDAAV